MKKPSSFLLLSRRRFLNAALGAGAAAAAGQFLPKRAAAADTEAQPVFHPGPDGPMGIVRIARLVPLGYAAAGVDALAKTQWVQLDLGRSHAFETIKLFPMTDPQRNSYGFPQRFRLEASDEPTFGQAAMIVDCTTSDYSEPGDAVSLFAAGNITGRYVRLTIERLRQPQFCLSKFEVWSGGRDVAEGCPARDSTTGALGVLPLTRAPRAQGEEVVTDNPGNVIPFTHWKPVAYQAHTPLSGVVLANGVFQTAMENNISYLLTSFSVDELLRPFRDRAGKPSPSGLPAPIPFWDTDLPGSNAGRFLMGAGNTLRWIDHPELQSRMTQVVNGIGECCAPNGYLMGFPDSDIFDSERAAYTRSWVTHGLIEAGYGGEAQAFSLLRGFYDWFDECRYLPELLRRAGQGVQGMIPNTRMYFTPVGKPQDIQVVQRYFQENYWMDQLAARDPAAIWLYPYDHPHCYLVTSLEPYLDQYLATGDKRYWDAAQGGWELYRDNWIHVGGSMAICEFSSYPPKSYFLHNNTGELCGSVFWVRYNQRFLLMHPEEEKYANEIERSIYNVGLANQAGATGIRYHANLVGHKDGGAAHNTCCEGQGTRLFGSLPEYIYSVADDGIYVNLYAASRLTWQQGKQEMTVAMTTEFPFQPDVRLTVSTSHPAHTAIRVRVPSWATHDAAITVNGEHATTGAPGTYVSLKRTWSDGDTIDFTLPIGFRTTLYQGLEQVPGQDQYALEYGPILMAVVGPMEEQGDAHLAARPADLISSLTPIAGQPLQFAIAGSPQFHYVPYWQVDQEAFSCYPHVGPAYTPAAYILGADDLALASKGATATSDSEYIQEPGGTAKVIDGTVAPPGSLTHRWHSSLLTPHPHWIQVNLPQPEMIERIVILFADPEGHPTSFQGIVRLHGRGHVVFDVEGYTNPSYYETKITPTLADNFRLVIRHSANPAFPNAAQISTIALYPAEGEKI